MSFDLFTTILKGLPMTLLLTAASLGIGMLGGVPLMLALRSRWRVLRVTAKAALELLRGVPPVVWLFLIMFGVGTSLVQLSPLAAALIGLGAISCAYLAEIYRGGLTAVHRGQWEAASALGMSRLDGFIRVIVPQMIRISVPAIATYGIGLLKDSSIAYTIGVQELMFAAMQQKSLSGKVLEPFLTVAFVYVVVSVIAAWGSRRLDAMLRGRVAR